jgi:hypothetical protein
MPSPLCACVYVVLVGFLADEDPFALDEATATPETQKLSPGDAGSGYQSRTRVGRNRSYPDIPPKSAILGVDGESHSADEPPSQSSSPLTSRSYPDHVYSGEHAHKRLVTDSLDAKVFDFFVKHAGPWVR